MNAAQRLGDLSGRTILVTGARGGIGAATMALLNDLGARAVGIDLHAGDGLLGCDLADPEAVRELFAQWRERGEALHGIVHCAGIARDGVLWKLSDEDWSEVLRTNLDSAFYLVREATPLMRANGGSIALVSSINGERGKFGQSNYTASKAGLIGFARTAARELGRFKVRVNVIAPGLIQTAMTADLPAEVLERALDETCLGALGEPDDVARVAYFLLSDLSRHVTGQVLRVDGGQLTA